MKVKRESEVAQSCLTLPDPIDCSLPGSSVHGIFQARVLQWGAIAFSESVSSIYIYNHTKIHLYMYNKPRQIEAGARENTRRLDTMSFSLLFFYSDMRYTFFKKISKARFRILGKGTVIIRNKSLIHSWSQTSQDLQMRPQEHSGFREMGFCLL